MVVIARDGFERTLPSGWGAAESGGPWTTAGPPAAFSVADGAGRLAVAPGTTPVATLADVVSRDGVVDAVLTPDRLPGTELTLTVGQRQIRGDRYETRVEIDAAGAVTLHLVTRSGTVERVLATQEVAGLQITAGTPLRVRTSALGTTPTTLAASVWVRGMPEPADWQIRATDSTRAVQYAGSVGLEVHLPAGDRELTLTVDDYSVTRAVR